jgi:uncharacterized membrane protein
MVGFAVASFRENGWRGLLSQGIGTSMLQIPNLVNHPLILIPQVISSLILGPLAACAFELQCVPAGAGMGTAGLVGIFGTIEGSDKIVAPWKIGVGITLCHFVLPALISLGLSELMRKFGWIKLGDQLLPLPENERNAGAEEEKEDKEASDGAGPEETEPVVDV